MIDYLLRSIPPFKGKQRLARFLLSPKIRAGKEITVLGKFGCIYKLPNIKENIGFEILINGIYEIETISFICKRVNRSGIVLDVGANIGAISIPVCKQRQDIQMIGLEAAPWVFEYLKLNVETNNVSNIRLINKAISDRSGIEVEFFSPKDKFGKGSLAPVFTEESVKVETITLDELSDAYKNRSIDFIKVDVEGFEALAFRGGGRLLSRPEAPDILFEFVDWAEELAGEKPGNAQLLLLNYGYDLYLFEHGKIGDRLETPLIKGGYLIFATKRN